MYKTVRTSPAKAEKKLNELEAKGFEIKSSYMIDGKVFVIMHKEGKAKAKPGPKPRRAK